MHFVKSIAVGTTHAVVDVAQVVGSSVVEALWFALGRARRACGPVE